MSNTSLSHQPVLLKQTIEGMSIDPNGIYVDATFGRGGHSKEILARLSSKGRLIALDRDLDAIRQAQKCMNDPRFSIYHTAFSELQTVLTELNLVGEIDGILLDIGVSSPQLDDASRGFSFQKDGPLDMRMDQSNGMSAAQWLNSAELDDITFVLKTFGEERFGKRIATAVVQSRQQKQLESTLEFVRIIEEALPVKDKHKHPATRSFQGVRIHINGELEQLKQALNQAVKCLKKGGVLAVISFHSLEDRVVKRFIKDMSKGPNIPGKLPITQAELDKNKTLKPLGKAIKPSTDEIISNPRSRSSVLRIAQRL